MKKLILVLLVVIAVVEVDQIYFLLDEAGSVVEILD